MRVCACVCSVQILRGGGKGDAKSVKKELLSGKCQVSFPTTCKYFKFFLIFRLFIFLSTVCEYVCMLL